MNRFNQMKIGTKLVLGFSLMVILVVAVGAVGYRSSRLIQNQLNTIFAVNMPALDWLIETDRDLQQLLVAERSMLFTPAGTDTFKALVADYEENLTQSGERWEAYKRLGTAPKGLVEQFEAAKARWLPLSRQVVKECQTDAADARDRAKAMSTGQASAGFEAMRDVIDQLTEISLAGAKRADNDARAAYRSGMRWQVGLLAFAFISGLALMWSIGRAVTGPLARVIAGLTTASAEVSSGSGQVATAGQTLAQGASEQAAAIEETSSSLEEMASMTRQNADHAAEADRLMQAANQVVQRANTTMGQLTGSMGEIINASEETGKIIKTIDEIAFQTNLLALNAAVEAARAGEAGAGFAVVADEVRNLAMRAAEAARNTASLIETTVRKIKDGSSLVQGTDQAFSEVTVSSRKVGELVSEIAAASREQAQGIEQINKAVNEMDKVTQSNAANAEESAAAAEAMQAQAEELLAYVSDLESLVSGQHRQYDGGKAGIVPSEPLHAPTVATAFKNRRFLAASVQDQQTRF